MSENGRGHGQPRSWHGCSDLANEMSWSIVACQLRCVTCPVTEAGRISGFNDSPPLLHNFAGYCCFIDKIGHCSNYLESARPKLLRRCLQFHPSANQR